MPPKGRTKKSNEYVNTTANSKRRAIQDTKKQDTKKK